MVDWAGYSTERGAALPALVTAAVVSVVLAALPALATAMVEVVVPVPAAGSRCQPWGGGTAMTGPPSGAGRSWRRVPGGGVAGAKGATRAVAAKGVAGAKGVPDANGCEEAGTGGAAVSQARRKVQWG